MRVLYYPANSDNLTGSKFHPSTGMNKLRRYHGSGGGLSCINPLPPDSVLVTPDSNLQRILDVAKAKNLSHFPLVAAWLSGRFPDDKKLAVGLNWLALHSNKDAVSMVHDRLIAGEEEPVRNALVAVSCLELHDTTAFSVQGEEKLQINGDVLSFFIKLMQKEGAEKRPLDCPAYDKLGFGLIFNWFLISIESAIRQFNIEQCQPKFFRIGAWKFQYARKKGTPASPREELKNCLDILAKFPYFHSGSFIDSAMSDIGGWHHLTHFPPDLILLRRLFALIDRHHDDSVEELYAFQCDLFNLLYHAHINNNPDMIDKFNKELATLERKSFESKKD